MEIAILNLPKGKNNNETINKRGLLQYFYLINTSAFKLTLCSLLMFASFYYCGLVLENVLMANKCWAIKEDHALAIKFCESVISSIVASVVVYNVMSTGNDSTRPVFYLFISFVKAVSKYVDITAFIYVSSQGLVIGRSIKPIIFMLFGVLFSRQRYRPQKYLFILTIALGEIIFVLDKPKNIVTGDMNESLIGKGELLAMISYVIDGLALVFQDKIIIKHPNKGCHMMLNVNLWTTLLCGAVLTMTDKGLNFIYVIQMYPSSVLDILKFSCACTIGQLFIYKIAFDFGILISTTITTMRKVCTIAASSILLGKEINSWQFFGLTLIFIGIVLNIIYG